MRLSKVEKIVVAVILLGLILIGGTFLLVVPSFERIGKETTVLEANLIEKAQLDERLTRLDTIDADITSSKNEAVKLEGGFFPDLTTYEASELAMAFMTSHNLEAHAIAIDKLSTRDLTLEYTIPAEAEYDLKTFSASARDAGSEEEGPIAGEFKDGGKTYSISVASATEATIIDSDGNEVAPAKYTDTMKKVYKAAICRFVAEDETAQTVAAITASYEVKGTFKDYMQFIDDMYKNERAIIFDSLTIPMTTNIEEDEDSDTAYINEAGELQIGSEANSKEVKVEDDTEVKVNVSITFLCVEPMQSLKTVDADGTAVVVDQRPAVY